MLCRTTRIRSSEGRVVCTCSGSWPNTDLKEYQAEIEIKDAPEKVRKLKPGMTAEIRIMWKTEKSLFCRFLFRVSFRFRVITTHLCRRS